jgi:hypothetical protein
MAEPVLLAVYELASARNYDWTGYPIAGAGKNTVAWREQLVNGQLTSQMVSGTNLVAQNEADFNRFVSGLMLGLGSG